MISFANLTKYFDRFLAKGKISCYNNINVKVYRERGWIYVLESERIVGWSQWRNG